MKLRRRKRNHGILPPLQSPVGGRPLPLRSIQLENGKFEFRHLLVFSDGAVRPAPYGWAGIGFSVFTDKGGFIHAVGQESRGKNKMGINRVEIWAGIRALHHVLEEFGQSGIVLHTDSDLFFRLAKKKYIARDEKIVKDLRQFEKVRSNHCWVKVLKVDRGIPKMHLPDRYSKEGASIRRKRAEGKYSGPYWKQKFTNQKKLNRLGIHSIS